MAKEFIGKLFGDKGYIAKKLTEPLAIDDVELITKLKKNMKPKAIALVDKILLRKRSVIETHMTRSKTFPRLDIRAIGLWPQHETNPMWPVCWHIPIRKNDLH